MERIKTEGGNGPWQTTNENLNGKKQKYTLFNVNKSPLEDSDYEFAEAIHISIVVSSYYLLSHIGVFLTTHSAHMARQHLFHTCSAPEFDVFWTPWSFQLYLVAKTKYSSSQGTTVYDQEPEAKQRGYIFFQNRGLFCIPHFLVPSFHIAAVRCELNVPHYWEQGKLTRSSVFASVTWTYYYNMFMFMLIFRFCPVIPKM